MNSAMNSNESYHIYIDLMGQPHDDEVSITYETLDDELAVSRINLIHHINHILDELM